MVTFAIAGTMAEEGDEQQQQVVEVQPEEENGKTEDLQPAAGHLYGHGLYGHRGELTKLVTINSTSI